MYFNRIAKVLFISIQLWIDEQMKHNLQKPFTKMVQWWTGKSVTSSEKALPRSCEASFAPSTRSTVRTLVASSDYET